jgi:DNA invertase Pin-like site-specific DNA recombinase
MNDVAAGQIDSIVCWRLDRLGKTCSELASLFECLSAARVNLISLRDQFDLSTPEGRPTANTLASVGLYETELRAERIIAGQEEARARGVRWGGSKRGRRLKVSLEVEQTVRRMRAEGQKIAHIAAATGLSRPTIYRIVGDDSTA